MITGMSLPKNSRQSKDGAQVGREGRFRALENLDPALRTKADEFAKKALIPPHGEWISVDLDSVKGETKAVGVRLQGGSFPFQGIKDRGSLLKELLQAPIGETTPSLSRYTQDGIHSVVVLDRKTDDQLACLSQIC